MTMQSFIQLLGGVGIFLFAIKLISEALQRIAGDRLRQLIGIFTRTPLLGVFVGALVTVLIQSSSATTVMTVSFVDAGLMTLTQAIGVIMGANIGTTVTGQILAIKVKDYAYLFVITGVLLGFLGRTKTMRYVGNCMLGFGLLFVGMQTMETSMAFLQDRQDIFLTFSNHPLLGVLAGTLLTLLVQSSSATVGLTIALGMQGLLPLYAAIPIILGDNIGTTVTAAVASIGAERAAKQACAAHILFNIIGVCIFLPLLPWYTLLIEQTASSIGHQIANAHTLFNICNTLLFLPFVPAFARFIRRIVPDQRSSAAQEGAHYLDPKLIQSSPIMAVEAVKNECAHLAFLAIDILDAVEDVFFNGKKERRDYVEATETNIDSIYRATKAYATELMQTGLPDNAVRTLSLYMSASADLERIADQAKKLIDYHDARQDKEHDFSPQAMKELAEMFADAHHAMVAALDALINDDPEKAREVAPYAERLRSRELELRTQHLQRLERQECQPEIGFIFMDSLGAIEHIGYHAKNLAKVTLKTCTPEGK